MNTQAQIKIDEAFLGDPKDPEVEPCKIFGQCVGYLFKRGYNRFSFDPQTQRPTLRKQNRN